MRQRGVALERLYKEAGRAVQGITFHRMLAKLFDLEDYAGTYRETRNAYLKAANQL